MRPISREYDGHEHQKPPEGPNMMWSASQGLVSFSGDKKKNADGKRKPYERMIRGVIMSKELSWDNAEYI